MVKKHALASLFWTTWYSDNGDHISYRMSHRVGHHIMRYQFHNTAQATKLSIGLNETASHRLQPTSVKLNRSLRISIIVFWLIRRVRDEQRRLYETRR